MKLPTLGQGPTLFGVDEQKWFLSISKGQIVIGFEKPLKKLTIDKKRAAFLKQGIKWMVKGVGLYGEADPDEHGEAAHAETLVALENGVKVGRRDGYIEIAFTRQRDALVMLPRCAEYFCDRIAAEMNAL